MTVKSQDDLGKQGRDSEVLITTIDELEKTKKENELLKKEVKSLYKKEESLVRKLNIAIDCLMKYSSRKNWKVTETGESCFWGTNGYEVADNAIDKMKQIKYEKENDFKPFSKRFLEGKISENKKLKKQLEIAKRGLNFIVAQSYGKDMWDCAKGTLKQIEELDK